jgi:2-hydroxychromene-2-carboxylate isomerase
VPFRLPPGHPAIALAATRAFYALEAEDAEAARAFARDVFHGIYQLGTFDSADPGQVAELGARHGLDRDALLRAIEDQALKDRVKAISQGAVARGIFGSPFFLVGGEPFWGADRMAMLEAWITTGGW